MTILDLAKQYYPRLWDDQRLELLVKAGQLTQKQVEKIKEEAHEAANNVLR